MAAEQERGVVARITMPRRRIGRSRFTEGETGELQKHELDRDITFADVAQQTAEAIAAGVCNERAGVKVVAVKGGDLEVGLGEGANHAVFSCGAGINRKRHTRTGGEVIAIAILLPEIARPRRLIVDAAVERGVDAQVTTQLHASISARNIPETGTIKGADPHVLDRFGLDGKISCLCSTHDDETRR